jgi:predicted transposase YbfD/YdcC
VEEFMTIETDKIEKIIEGRELELKNIADSFLNLKDNRYICNIRYTLEEVFFLVLCAQICGYESFREYQAYGKIKLNFLRSYLPYTNGIPSHTTIGKILAIINHTEIELKFKESIEKIVSLKNEEMKRINEEKNENIQKNKIMKSESRIDLKPENDEYILDEIEQNVLPIDGKRHRGCINKCPEDNTTLHVVSAFSTTHGLTLGQVKVADKTNEIKAIPELLDLIDISGQIVTIDAAGCQTEIVDKIRSKKADYIIALKGNQGNLHKNVKNCFENPEMLLKCKKIEIENKGHGREEKRICHVLSAKNILYIDEKWTDLETIVMLESTRVIKGITQKQTRYYISSLPDNPKKIQRSIRLHWNIENNCHWMLDVVFQEDKRIIWNHNIAYNESMIRRLSLNLLKEYQGVAEPIIRSDKIAIKTIRKVVISDDYRMSKLLNCFSVK